MGLTDRESLVEKFGLHRKYEKEWMDLRNTDVDGYLEQVDYVQERLEDGLDEYGLEDMEVRDNRDSIVLKPTGPTSASADLLVVAEDEHDSQYALGVEVDPRTVWLDWDSEPSEDQQDMYRLAEDLREDWADQYGFATEDVSIADPAAIQDDGIDHFRKHLEEYDVEQ